MQSLLVLSSLLPFLLSTRAWKVVHNSTLFRDEQIIFFSKFNITRILVPAEGIKNYKTDPSQLPSIYFTIADPKIEEGTCIYALKGFMVFEILKGGRDTTADYTFERDVYFGGKNGLYKYDHDQMTAKKFGVCKYDIIQLQKARGIDTIYALTAERKLFKIDNNGNTITKNTHVVCAIEFVLDTSNNIYYIDCYHKLHILRTNGQVVNIDLGDIKYIKLLRPPFVMDKCIPFFGDDFLYILNSNGTFEKKDFKMKERPSAISVDAALYLVAALNRTIYEFNVMEVLLKSMFGFGNEKESSVSKVMTSLIEIVKDTFIDNRHLEDMVYD